ncbi:CdaR family protein [Tamlana sp. I1]|uniref:CdaR family protein n=1 Tax=Tamlana sp. I1 TaxID=2762061 RepID=UPI00293BEE27|nr:CdaR family protein [Tamlana sp. I1]
MSSFIILIFTKLSKSYTDTIPFEIEKINIPDEYVILNDSVKLNITLKTHGFRWLNYYFSTPKVKIDFTNDVSKEGDVFIYNKSKAYLNNTQFDKKVELLNLSPEKLKFRYGVNLVKKVPVKLHIDVNYSPGYNTSTKMIINPDSVLIVGPDVLVSKINYLDTETKKLKDVRSDLHETVKLKLPKNASDIQFSSTQITAKATVEKFTEGTLKIPVSVINVPENIIIKFFPKVVSVSYYVSLSNFEKITAKDFEVICDYKKTNEEQSFLIPELTKVPELVKYSKINQQRVEFIITK